MEEYRWEMGETCDGRYNRITVVKRMDRNMALRSSLPGKIQKTDREGSLREMFELAFRDECQKPTRIPAETEEDEDADRI